MGIGFYMNKKSKNNSVRHIFNISLGMRIDSPVTWFYVVSRYYFRVNIKLLILKAPVVINRLFTCSVTMMI